MPLLALGSGCGKSSDVLLSEFTGPYGGVPQFDAMEVAALKPALETGMARRLAEIDAIAKNPAPPDFENTIVEFERSGKDLGRVLVYRGILSSNLSTPEFREATSPETLPLTVLLVMLTVVLKNP
jgi:peptidyl-dipeptidase Dcp